jgi:hypothetical protein
VKRSRIRSRPKPREDEAERIAHDLFRQEAQKQRCCQMCGNAQSGWHPHHVIYAQHLKLEGHPVYDTRNAMRLCVECHASHHNRSIVIPLFKLRDMHIEYAFLKMGAKAHYYLSQRYEGQDERLDIWLAKVEGEEDERRTASSAL